MINYKIIIILTVVNTSCSFEDDQKNMTTIKDKFTWNIQKAGYDYSKYDEKGEIDYENFITEFERFPWLEQLDILQKIQEGCSPTLSVQDLKFEKEFWVSMAGSRNEHGYLIGYVYPKEKKGFLGIGKSKTIKWLEIYLTDDPHVVKNSYKFFFERKYNSLEETIRQLEEYGQMEAQN